MGQKSSVEIMQRAFTIRMAQPRDIPAIAGLLDQLNRFEGYAQVTDARALEAALFAPRAEVKLAAFVAMVGQRVVGALLYYPGYDTLSASYGFHLADMVVDETHRKHGVGTALMKALAKCTLEESKEWISLTALRQNDAARGFYQSLGMSEVSVDFFAMGKHTMIDMVET